MHVATGDLARAWPLFQRSLALSEQALGPDHVEVAIVLTALASAYDIDGRPRDAVPLLDRAVAIYDAHSGTLEMEMEARVLLARSLVKTGGDRARARAQAIAARDEMRAADPRGDDLLAEVEIWLAEHPP